MKKTKTLGLTPRGKIVDAVVPGLLRGAIFIHLLTVNLLLVEDGCGTTRWMGLKRR